MNFYFRKGLYRNSSANRHDLRTQWVINPLSPVLIKYCLLERFFRSSYPPWAQKRFSQFWDVYLSLIMIPHQNNLVRENFKARFEFHKHWSS